MFLVIGKFFCTYINQIVHLVSLTPISNWMAPKDNTCSGRWRQDKGSNQCDQNTKRTTNAMKNFEDKVAAITGAGSGMGQTLAINLAAQGCHLSISDVNEKGLAETIRLLQPYDVSVIADIVDVADKDAVYQWADKVVADHGKVNLIFNNAGVALASTIEAMSYDELDWILNINMWGVIYGTKAFLPHLKASGEGHIINTSSIFGLFAQPTQSAYNISKFAVRGFTESLRQELELEGSCVSATCVHPGGIKTNIAAASKSNPSIQALTGQTHEESVKKFETAFINSADRAAKIILQAVRKNKRRVLVGPDAKGVDVMIRLLPALYQRIVLFIVRKQYGIGKKRKSNTAAVPEG